MLFRCFVCALFFAGCTKDAPAAFDAGRPPPPMGPSFGTLPRAGEQSYPDAWRAFCDAEQQMGQIESMPKQQRAQMVARYVHDHVRNQDFVFFLAEMQGTRPDERRRRYQEQLAAAGIAKCALGEKFFPPPQP